MSDSIKIEVIYALPDEQMLFNLSVPAGATVIEALRLSGVFEKYPEINLEANKIGLFGKLTKPDTLLREKDRIEIYRPIQADPKQVRKNRAAKNTKGSGVAGAISGC